MDMNSSTALNDNCTNDAAAHSNEISYHSQDCCTIKVIDSKVKDNYLSDGSNITNHIQFISILPPQNISIDLVSYNQTNKIYFDTSPPHVLNTDLYLHNSTLLI